MILSSFTSLAEYSRFVAELFNRSSVERSTVVVWSESPYTGVAEGEVFFSSGLRLRMREEMDFEAHLIASYSYEVYKGDERLYWYDDFPHPKDFDLASSFPHHKHVPPNIKHHRIPAASLSFDHPNLPAIIDELESIS